MGVGDLAQAAGSAGVNAGQISHLLDLLLGICIALLAGMAISGILAIAAQLLLTGKRGR